MTVSTASTEYLTPTQAAKISGVSVWTIYNHIKAGKLRAARAGGSRSLIRIRREWLDDFLSPATDPAALDADVDAIIGGKS